MTNASPATGFPASSTTRPEKLALSISILKFGQFYELKMTKSRKVGILSEIATFER